MVNISPDFPGKSPVNGGEQTRGKTAPHPLSGANPGVEARVPAARCGGVGGSFLLIPCRGGRYPDTLARVRDERLFGSARVPGSG